MNVIVIPEKFDKNSIITLRSSLGPAQNNSCLIWNSGVALVSSLSICISWVNQIFSLSSPGCVDFLQYHPLLTAWRVYTRHTTSLEQCRIRCMWRIIMRMIVLWKSPYGPSWKIGYIRLYTQLLSLNRITDNIRYLRQTRMCHHAALLMTERTARCIALQYLQDLVYNYRHFQLYIINSIFR